jgi:hypothetical protein
MIVDIEDDDDEKAKLERDQHVSLVKALGLLCTTAFWLFVYDEVWLRRLGRTRVRVAVCTALSVLLLQFLFWPRGSSSTSSLFRSPQSAVFVVSGAGGMNDSLDANSDSHRNAIAALVGGSGAGLVRSADDGAVGGGGDSDDDDDILKQRDVTLRGDDGNVLTYSERLALYASASVSATNSTELAGFIRFFNKHSPWINLDRFELEPGFVPIVMRANRRKIHVLTALERLERVARINRTVLIVSHDSLDIDLINSISNIRFMVTRQIINPYSANIFLSRFPGTDEHAKETLDRHGNKRLDGKFPGIKHHFLWHLSYVWRHLLPAQVSDVLLIEEDHLPTFDFYIASRSLLSLATTICPDCGGVLVGHHSRNGAHNITQVIYGRPFAVGAWGHNANLGMSISRNTWRMMLDNALSFCNFDDYNWDLSLERLRATRNLPPYLLSMRWSRLLHFGICGATHESRRKGDASKQSCEAAEAEILAMIDRKIEPDLRSLYDNSRNSLLQNATIVARIAALRQKPPRRFSNSGTAGADPRDVFWYLDDDGGVAEQYFPALANGLWQLDELRAAKPLKHVGWGGFGRLDQQLCTVIAGVSSLLLPPLPANRQLPSGLFEKADSAILNELRRTLDPISAAVYVGCFEDRKWARDLGQHHGIVKSRGDCLLRCRAARLPFAGVQFSNECWCGLSYGLHAKVDESECNMPCEEAEKDGTRAICGAGDRNSVLDLRPAVKNVQ